MASMMPSATHLRSFLMASMQCIPRAFNVCLVFAFCYFLLQTLTLNLDDTILDLWQAPVNRPPIDTHHPAVRTHPVTSLKALNVNPGFVSGFAELKKVESDKILDFINYHIHSGDDHAVRWKWEVGSVAMWDNRYLKLMIRFWASAYV